MLVGGGGGGAFGWMVGSGDRVGVGVETAKATKQTSGKDDEASGDRTDQCGRR